MTFAFERPPAELTWYHLGPLLDAEAGTIKYDKDRYRVSGVSNNATACVWCNLLAPANDGLVLTDLGRQMLADWKASPKGQAWLSEWAEQDNQHTSTTHLAGSDTPTHTSQLSLFESTT